MTRDVRLWHVTVTVAGTAMEPLIVRGALQRFSQERPLLSSLRFAADRAEICYWDEGVDVVDVGSLALRLWAEHRDSARLPDWQVVGLEIVERDLQRSRQEARTLAELSVLPLSF